MRKEGMNNNPELGAYGEIDAALDENQAISSAVGPSGTADTSGVELNCLMRLTDDYLLMTTSKNNAMLFIEKMYKLSLVSNFKFNMKKLKTNFFLNL
jgi:hypothetical protein